MLRRLSWITALLVLFASAARAEPAAWSSDSLSPGGSASFVWSSSDATGDHPALDVRRCGELRFTSEVSGSPSVGGYLVPTATTATSSGTLAVTVTTTSRTLLASVQPGLQFLRPNLGAVGSGGRLEVRCVGYSSSGGGGSAGLAPGVVGTSGNDATLDYLYALRNIVQMPTGPVYFFSCAAGGDYVDGNVINPGTQAAPFKNFAQARFVARDGVTLRFDQGDSCFIWDTADAIDFGSGFAFGDWRPSFRVDSSRPGLPAVLTQNTAAGSAGLFHVHNDGASAVSSAGGVVIFQDVRFAGSTTAVITVDDGIRFVTQNIGCTAADGTTEECLRPAADTRGLSLNLADSSSFNGSFYVGTEMSDMTFIGRSRIFMSAPAAVANARLILINGNAVAGFSENITAGKPNRLNVVGHDLFIPESNAADKQIVRLDPSVGVDGETWLEVNLARVGVYGSNFGGGACLAADERPSRRTVYRFIQSSMAECDLGIRTLSSGSATAVEAGTLREARNSIFQLGAGVTSIYSMLNAGSAIGGRFVFRNNFVHQHTGTVSALFAIRDEGSATDNSATVADMRTALADESAAMQAVFADFFPSPPTDPLVSAGATPTDDQFDGTGYRCADTLGTGGTACFDVADCTGVNTPNTCCNGASTPDTLTACYAAGGTADGFCDSGNLSGGQGCTGAGAPAACCTGAGTGTCDAYGSVSGTAGLCARKVETMDCDEFPLAEDCAGGGLGRVDSVPVWIWGPIVGSPVDLTTLNLTAKNLGAR